MDLDTLVTTRRALHAAAELLLAGPQYRTSGTIRLAVGSGGFSTVTEPDVAVRGVAVLVRGREVGTLTGTATYAELAAAGGLDAGAPAGLYSDLTGTPLDEVPKADPEAADLIAKALADGTAALGMLAPEETPVLWPEHFDVGISLAEVNYGVSAGDGLIAEPYAYVGPWTPREGAFWNQSFGAARPLSELGSAAAVYAFFEEGRRLAAEGKGEGMGKGEGDGMGKGMGEGTGEGEGRGEGRGEAEGKGEGTAG